VDYQSGRTSRPAPPSTQARIYELVSQLSQVEAQLEQLMGDGIDAVLSPQGSGPILLRSARAALVESEAHFRALFDHALDALVITDDTGRFVEINAAACALFGLPQAALLGRTAADFAPAGYDVAQARREFVSAGKLRGRFQVQRPDGDVRETEFTATTQIVPGRNLAILRDVTERTESEHYLQAVLDSLTSHIAVLDGAGVIVAVNRAWTAFAQANGDPTLVHTGIGVNYFEAVRRGQDADAAVRDILAGLAAVMAGTLPSYSIEYPCFRGERHDWFLLTATPLANGRRRGIVVAHQDITLRKQAEDALRRQAQETLALVEHNPDPVGRFDRQLRHLYVNAAVEQATGRPASAFLGKTNRELKTMPPEIVDLWEATQTQVFATGREQTIQFVHSGKEHYTVYETRFAPEYSVDGRVETILSISRDVTARVMAEEQERSRGQEFRALIEHNPDMVARLDRDLRYRYLNRKLLQLLGLPLDQCVGKSYRELGFLEQVVDRLDAALDAVLAQGCEQHIELDIGTPDGPAWLDIRLIPETADDGTVATILAIGRDITQRKQAEEQLRYQAALLHGVSDAIIGTDARFRITVWNPGAEALYGWRAEEVLGREMGSVLSTEYPHEYPHDTLEQVQQALWAHGEWRGEVVQRRRDGTRIDVTASSGLVRDGKGQVIGSVAVMEDITQHKLHEREREALLAVATAIRTADSPDEMLSIILHQIALSLNAATTCFAAADPATGEIVVDAAHAQGATRLHLGLRLPQGQGIGVHVYQTGQPYVTDDAASDPYYVNTGLITERAVACVPLLTPERIIGLLLAARPEPWTEQEMRLFAAIADMVATGLERATLHKQVVDYAAHLEEQVTVRTRELSEANERLQELDRLKSKFVSNVTHELRTPITNLNLYLKLLARKPENQAKYMAVLTEQAERLGTLVKDVLDLSRLDSRLDQLTHAPVDLNEVVQTVAVAHAARAEALNLALSFAPDAALPPLQGDRDKLIQVVTNLVANALNYTPAGAVALRTYGDAARTTVYCEVKDTGCGIYDEDLPHLFDRFYRGKRDQAAPVPGTGLGLSIVKELVELHRGAITVASAVGAGSTFTISLPVA
jgi:PAS domain S-box-containing protein